MPVNFVEFAVPTAHSSSSAGAHNTELVVANHAIFIRRKLLARGGIRGGTIPSFGRLPGVEDGALELFREGFGELGEKGVEDF